MIDAGQLLERAQREGWNVVALDFGLDLSTPNGKLVANVLVSVAEWERDTIGKRTSEALAEKQSQGVQVGRPQTIDPKRRAQLRSRIRKLRGKGWSYGRIADQFNADATPTPTGEGRWHPSGIRRIEDPKESKT